MWTLISYYWCHNKKITYRQAQREETVKTQHHPAMAPAGHSSMSSERINKGSEIAVCHCCPPFLPETSSS